MKASSNLYALAALRERRAELAGEIKTLESRARHLRESLVHVDGTLRLFDPDANPASIKPKRPYKRVKLFGQGKLNRLILDALRKAERPLRTQEVIDAIAAEVSFGPIHVCIYSTIKALKFSVLSQICGGPIELATITTDRRFRWVRHKEWDSAISDGDNQ